MLNGTSRLETFSGDGETQVLSYVEISSGSRKCLEDPFNPESEALETLSSNLKNISALIVPPCSSRTINALREAAPDLKTVIIADYDHERITLWKKSFETELKNCEILELPKDLKDAEEVLRERLMNFECEIFLGRCAVYIPERFRRIDKPFSEFLESKVLFLQRESCSAAATRSMWSWRRTLNQLLNAGERPVHRIDEKKQERPSAVVIVGAGPSLDSNIKDLKDYSDRALIISTDAALNTMLENDVRPHLIASMDSGPLMWRLFEKNLEKIKDIPLAASLDSNHLLYKDYPGKILLFAEDIANSSLKKGLPDVQHGKCVGHFAFHIAESLKPETIVMVGFDLAYRDGQFYSSSMPYKGFADFKKSYQSTSSFVEAAGGGMVQTDLSLEFFLKYFENAIASSPCKVIDATEGGALKRGAKIAGLRETLASLPPAPSLALETNRAFIPEEKAKLIISIHQALSALSPKLLKIKGEAKLMTAASVRNPLKDIDLNSEEFKLVSSCANFLLMTEWANAIKSYSPKSIGKFKDVLESLADDLHICSETLSTALEAASKNWIREKESHIALVPDSLDPQSIKIALETLAPRAAVFKADTPLHTLWREMIRLKTGSVICFDGNTAPELWTVPELPCIDVKSSFNPSPHDKTLWLPGYKILCLSEDCLSKWKAHLPTNISCSLLRRAQDNG